MDAIIDELRACYRRGKRPPPTADIYALYEATGGDGYLALYAALEYRAALMLVKREMQQAARDRQAPAWLAA